MPDPAAPPEPVNLPEPAIRIRRWTWRLVLSSAAIGAISAFAAAIVRLSFRGLQWIFTGSSADPPVAAIHLALWRRAITPVLGALFASMVLLARKPLARRLGRDPVEYVEYVEAVRRKHGCIPMLANLWRTLSAAFSVGSGAAIGREGSMIQFAAAIASAAGRWRAWADSGNPATLSFLVACGVAGGVTTAYNAPVAAVFFAIEIVLGSLQWLELPFITLAAAAGWLVSGALLGRKPLYPVHPPIDWKTDLPFLIAAALLAGLAGPVYQWLLGSLRTARRLPLPLIWSGLLVGTVSLLDPRVWGNGDVGLSAALGHAQLPGIAITAPSLARLLGLRLLATSLCVWTGTVGGVFTPTLFTGGTLGALLGDAFGHLVPGTGGALWAIAGMSCFLAAVTHAPLMATFMAAELTGDWALVPLLLPLNYLAWTIARRLSPRALYAIASQQPALRPPKTENKTVQ